MKLAGLIHAVELGGGGIDVAAVASADVRANSEMAVEGIYYRSQEVRPGGVFVAIKGHSVDGHRFIGQAIERGAVAVFCERLVPGWESKSIPVLDGRKAMAAMAAEFFGHPSRRMTIIGVTGTSGKTTTSYLIESILKAAGISVGVIGTVNYRFGGQRFTNPVTTPESVDLQRILAQMLAAGTTHVVMEISSHALALRRVHACDVDLAVFTNFSQDHLDFHQTMAAYWESKRRLFTHVVPASTGKCPVRAVINTDDAKGAELLSAFALARFSTGHGQGADIRIESEQADLRGISAVVRTPQGALSVQSSLVGRHNVENVLNAIGVSLALGLDVRSIESGIAALDRVPGRLDQVADPAGSRFVYVDYAHKPDALEKALKSLRAIGGGRVICVFGCGGDRDRAKRPLMGAIAARLSDLTVVTSDNPRSEPPEQIIAQIVAGVRQVCDRAYSATDLAGGFASRGYVVVPDRREAIALGIRVARPADTVLIAGKGHENYQIIGTERLAFDDHVEARQALEAAFAAPPGAGEKRNAVDH